MQGRAPAPGRSYTRPVSEEGLRFETRRRLGTVGGGMTAGKHVSSVSLSAAYTNGLGRPPQASERPAATHPVEPLYLPVAQ